MQVLVAAGAAIDAVDATGCSALIIAAGDGNQAILELLVKAGANLDKQDHQKQTAAHWAFSMGHCETGQWLLANGANPSLRDEEGKLATDWMPEAEEVQTSRSQEALAKAAGPDPEDREWKLGSSKSDPAPAPTPTAEVSVGAAPVRAEAKTVDIDEDRIRASMDFNAMLSMPAWTDMPLNAKDGAKGAKDDNAAEAKPRVGSAIARGAAAPLGSGTAPRPGRKKRTRFCAVQ